MNLQFFSYCESKNRNKLKSKFAKANMEYFIYNNYIFILKLFYLI